MTSVFRRVKKQDKVEEPIVVVEETLVIEDEPIVVEEPVQKKSKKELKKELKKEEKKRKNDLKKEQKMKTQEEDNSSSFITSLFRKDTIDSIISTPEETPVPTIDETIPEKKSAIADLEKSLKVVEIIEEPKMKTLIIKEDEQIIEDVKTVELIKSIDNEEVIMSNKTYTITANLSNEPLDVTTICFKNDDTEEDLLKFIFFKSKKEMRIVEKVKGIFRTKLILKLRYLDNTIITKLGGSKIPLTIKNTKTVSINRATTATINLATWTMTNCEFN